MVLWRPLFLLLVFPSLAEALVFGSTGGGAFLNEGGDTTGDGANFTFDDVDNVLHVDSTGNRVGIGTSSPAEKLDVVGVVKVTATNAGLGGLDITDDGASGRAATHLTNDAGKRATAVVYGSGFAGSQLGVNIADSFQLVNVDADVMAVGSLQNTPLVFSTYDTERVRITGDGNVGVGTASPSERLDIATGDDDQIALSPDVGVRFRIKNYNNSIKFYYNTANSCNVSFTNIDPAGSVRVGVGTTSPTTLLDVSTSSLGDGAILGNVFTGVWNDGTDYAVFSHKNFRTSNSNTAYAFIQDSLGESYFNSALGQDLNFAIGGTRKMVLDSSGNVGVGTVSPSEKLDVNGGAAITGSMRVGGQALISDGSPAAPSLAFSNDTDTGIYRYNDDKPWLVAGGELIVSWVSNGLWIKDGTPASPAYSFWNDIDTGIFGGTGYVGNLGFTTNGIEAMRIDDSQNVGVGTTSPAHKLDVEGNVSSAIAYFYNADNSGNGIALKAVGSTSDSGVAYLAGNSGSISGVTNKWFGTLGTTNTGGGVAVMGSATGNGMAGWFEGGNVYIEEKLGIGTTTPDNPLHVMKSALTGAAAGSTGVAAFEDANYAELYLLGGITSSIMFGDADKNSVGQLVYNHLTDSMRFFTNGSEQVRIDDSGNVGIGTATPSNKLDVYGRVFIKQQSDTSVSGLSVSNVGGGRNINLWVTSSDVAVVDSGNSGNQDLCLNSGEGNVGIGTTTPRRPLHVYGSAGLVAERIGYDTTYYLDVGYDISNEYGYLQAVAGAGVYDDITINPNGGKVGVGTATPRRKLDILDGTSDQLRLTHTDNSVYSEFMTDSSGNLNIAVTGTKINFGSENIVTTGNVGVGTASPATPLHVAAAGSETPGDGFLRLQNEDSVNYAWDLRVGSHVGSGSNLYLDRYSGGWSNVLTADRSNGNVGIGVSDPDSLLEVAGEVHVGDVDTGVNAGTDLCIDVNGRICACGSCA